MGNKSSKKSFDVHQSGHGKDRQKSQNGHNGSVSISDAHAAANNVVLEFHQPRSSPSPNKVVVQNKSPVDDGIFDKPGRLGFIDAESDCAEMPAAEFDHMKTTTVSNDIAQVHAAPTPTPTPAKPTSPLLTSAYAYSKTAVIPTKVPLATFDDMDTNGPHEAAEAESILKTTSERVQLRSSPTDSDKTGRLNGGDHHHKPTSPIMDTVVIDKIEEVSGGKRGSAVLVGEHLLLEVPEYAVSEPDSDRVSIPTDEGLEELLVGRNRGGSDVSLHEMTSAEVAEDLAKHLGEKEPASSQAVVDEPISSAQTKSAGGQGDDEIGATGLLHDVEWSQGGNAVFVRGSFSDWQKKPMNLIEQGSFAFTFPILKGVVYFYNFVVDDVICTDPTREQVKYYVGDKEEDVHSVCVDE